MSDLLVVLRAKGRPNRKLKEIYQDMLKRIFSWLMEPSKCNGALSAFLERAAQPLGTIPANSITYESHDKSGR